MATKDGRGYVAGKYTMELDGINAGWLFSMEGGHATSDVVTEKLGPDHLARKHVAGVKYEDISVSCGTGMARGFYQWIEDSFQRKYSRKNGAIVAANYDYKEISRLTFTNALITEVGFPALDASSKDSAKLSVKFAPEYTREALSLKGGPSIYAVHKIDAKVQKKWSPANFRLRIDGLDEACSRCNKIEAIVLKQKVVENPKGFKRDREKEPATLEIPNLVITVPESHSEKLYKWHEDFIVKGINGDDKERTGTLEFLSSDLKEVLFQIDMTHLGLFKLTPEKVESGSENIRRIKAELYCEEMKLKLKAVWA